MRASLSIIENRMIAFDGAIEEYALPEKFTFPFYYDPHPLCILAAKELQNYIQHQKDWVHNFGLDPAKEGMIIGKMFGVLVVQNQKGALGYLAAFSGKLAGKNDHPIFVPPVFDLLKENSFFIEGEIEINTLNHSIESLENDPKLANAKLELEQEIAAADLAISEEKINIKLAKANRKNQRSTARESLNEKDLLVFLENLAEQSKKAHFDFKDLTKYWQIKIAEAQLKLDLLLNEIKELKAKRKGLSIALQNKIFDQYHFLNKEKNTKSLLDLFEPTSHKIPPAGAGECAAPKLLQYAFLHDLKPIAMAEFWWGQPPKSAVRKHKQFYPACNGKCKPILAHMLKGMVMDENPMLQNLGHGKKIEIVYEDEEIVVINKPPELLSVPGKNIEDSVYTRMKIRYPEATGPLILHRLDMSTSGLMIIAKTKPAHKYIQYQFIKRLIKKRYEALLEGKLEKGEGEIDLPLRVDLDDRPRQLVCYTHGKPAQTRWKEINQTEQYTKVNFFPITGRTHQLRVHAAHPLGLNTPILGDDLYGNKGKRLHLHAAEIQFTHPRTKELMTIKLPADF